jgi:hypothetical protein
MLKYKEERISEIPGKFIINLERKLRQENLITS